MSQRPLLLSFVAGAVIGLSLATPCAAQWRPTSQPFQKPFRFLGHGWGTGYHWRTPGHDSSYYNPYSAHNTNLISNGGHWGAGNSYAPEYGKSHGPTGLQNPTPNYPSIEGEFQPVRNNGRDSENYSSSDDLKSAIEPSEDDELIAPTKGEAEERKKTNVERIRKPTEDLPAEWPFELKRD